MVYLDNSATTRPSQAVRDAMVHSMEEVYFNPSALYGPAMQAEKELTAARKALADQLGVPAKNVIFTSGGTAIIWLFWATCRPCGARAKCSIPPPNMRR